MGDLSGTPLAEYGVHEALGSLRKDRRTEIKGQATSSGGEHDDAVGAHGCVCVLVLRPPPVVIGRRLKRLCDSALRLFVWGWCLGGQECANADDKAAEMSFWNAHRPALF